MRSDNIELAGLSSRMSVLSPSCLLWELETLIYNRIALLKNQGISAQSCFLLKTKK